MKTLALILAGGRGTRLDLLSADRAKPGVPFGGKYRLIDFTLSNCVNSSIHNVGILTQYLPRLLNDHIGLGRPWDLDRQFGGVTLLHPYTGQRGGWYQGTAHAVYRNLDYIKEQDPEYIIILSGDHIYRMNYSKMVDYHQKQGADLTIAVKPVPIEDAHQFGILETNDEMEIVDFQEKPEEPASNLASLGIYVFTTEALINKLEEFCDQEHSDFGHHIIPQMIDNDNVFAYEYNGYWQDVGTLKAYWETNLALTQPESEVSLCGNGDWPCYTRSQRQPPVKLGNTAEVIDSLICDGAVINGRVENSIISPEVSIEEGAVVKESIIFNGTRVKSGAVVSKTIIDKDVTVGEGVNIGCQGELEPNFEKPKLLYNGLNIIGKEARIPAGIEIERNCRICPRVKERQFIEEVMPSGSTLRPRNYYLYKDEA